MTGIEILLAIILVIVLIVLAFDRRDKKDKIFGLEQAELIEDDEVLKPFALHVYRGALALGFEDRLPTEVAVSRSNLEQAVAADQDAVRHIQSEGLPGAEAAYQTRLELRDEALTRELEQLKASHDRTVARLEAQIARAGHRYETRIWHKKVRSNTFVATYQAMLDQDKANFEARSTALQATIAANNAALEKLANRVRTYGLAS